MSIRVFSFLKSFLLRFLVEEYDDVYEVGLERAAKELCFQCVYNAFTYIKRPSMRSSDRGGSQRALLSHWRAI